MMVVMKSDVAVIGAGMSGLLLARELARSKIKVRVYDQKQKLGYPVRASSILSVSGLDSLGIDFGKIPYNKLCGARLYAEGKMLEIRAKKAMAYSMDRHKLNSMLKDECKDLGVEIMTGKRIEERDLDDISRDSIVVGADGFNSTVARHYGFGGAVKHVLTYRAEYIADIEDTSMVELFFDKAKIQGFFGWIAPEPQRVVEIGVGIDSRFGNSKVAYDRFIAMQRVGEFIESATLKDHGASVIPIGLRRHFVDEKKGVLLIGDAAGQVKPTTGGGIIFGGNAALIAANVIKNHMEKGTRLAEYERLWRRRHETDLRMHGMIKDAYSKLSAAQIASILGFLEFTGMHRFLGDYGDMDRPSLMLKRFFLRGLAN